MKKTKIIASVTEFYEKEKIIELYKSGVNCLRFNFSHANHQDAEKLMKQVKSMNNKGITNLSIVLDTKGPEIRVGEIAGIMELKTGDIMTIVRDKNFLTGKKLEIYSDYSYLVDDVEIGDSVLIDSGLLTTIVVDKAENSVDVKTMNDSTIKTKRHINLPWVKLKLPGMTEKDKEDIKFACEQGVDYIAASFVRNRENLLEIKARLKENNGEHIQIISKIENQEALDNLEEIVKESDGVMVARWDLWVEVPIQMVPFYQKEIMNYCFKYGKFVVIATEMLKSMVNATFPTRAEVSDVYNSVIMRTDATMLSDETAIGNYPILAVEMMSKTLIEAEKTTNNKHKDFEAVYKKPVKNELQVVVKHALNIADEIWTNKIIAFSKTGLLARVISAYRPNHPVFVFTDKEIVTRLHLYFAIFPMTFENKEENMEKNYEKAIKILKQAWNIQSGETIVTISDCEGGENPTVQVLTIK